MLFFRQILLKFFFKKKSTFAGRDESGNEYYYFHNKDSAKKEIRFVLYNGIIEPTKIPASWHRWLHYTSVEAPISDGNILSEKRIPNYTGTKFSYNFIKHSSLFERPIKFWK